MSERTAPRRRALSAFDGLPWGPATRLDFNAETVTVKASVSESRLISAITDKLTQPEKRAVAAPNRA
jgi:hypothetical protein